MPTQLFASLLGEGTLVTHKVLRLDLGWVKNDYLTIALRLSNLTLVLTVRTSSIAKAFWFAHV